ncbi:similar to Saccharomyces cerevisiae YOR346W REV1 Deoxycytidyl transferase [Maudiozyma saulgeensis]|uniref:DNA repair protein REV1 n=1 Tax=Maudiozyma saulgeensis TaxID=1789683 RepID=A0A1X7R655_9SACH|nr:similar to Saccharomyces cerevisiae YOR346W REV1 Deoxycytidyl transferase [Kazachstania saulgeensis]
MSNKDNKVTEENSTGRYSYFYNKKIKQAEQDIKFRKQYETIGKQTSQLLKGLTIYVNGHTIPGRLQIHDMVVLNGGNFLHHLSSKGSATHIIASSLPPKKRLEFKNYKVINPQWLVDCIKQQKIVPWQEYSIIKSDIEQPSILKISSSSANKTPPNCNDPNFLIDYFKHSRLHHLSEWKASLRQKFIELYQDIPLLTHSNSSYTILHIDFDCFFATVAYLFRDKKKFPTLDFDKDPIVVCHGVKNSDIASCNYAARKLGIKNGMWVGTAEKMLPNGIKLTTLPYEFENIDNGSKAFYTILQSIEQFYYVLPVSIDEAICVMSKNAMENKQTLLQLCNAVRQRIKHETSGCIVSIGVSDSLVLARLALKMAKPNGVFMFDNDNESQDLNDMNQFWGSFKLDDLPGVGRSTLKKLRYKYPKVKTLQDLRQTCQDIISLQSILGNKLGEKVYLALRGEDDEESARIIYDPINMFQRKSISIDINWGIRFKDMVEIDKFLDICSDYLVNKKLAEYNKLTSSITLKLMKRCVDAPVDPPKYMGMGRCDPFTTSSRLGVPTNDGGIIATELKHMFRTLPVPPVELRGISIQFNKLVDPDDPKNSNVKKGLSLLFQKDQVTTTPSPSSRSIESPLHNVESNDPHRKYKRLKRSPVKEREDQLESNQRNAFQQQFFQELPTQIRKDVQHDLKITRKVNDSKLKRMKEELQRRENAIRNMNSHFMNSDSIFVPIKFQNETNFEKICSMVNDWVRETIKEKGPHERDLHFFKKYLNKLCDSDRVHFVLRLADMISVTLNLMAHKYGNAEGFTEWEIILIKFIIPLMNRNRHTFRTERKLDIEYDI